MWAFYFLNDAPFNKASVNNLISYGGYCKYLCFIDMFLDNI